MLIDGEGEASTVSADDGDAEAAEASVEAKSLTADSAV
ncbi:hypothetical protein N802_04615 [Knoellia sinensis KCTC 19936]|uniref:Uncharacterized protein n=1 Tax=Knoellia sinensis KCTC 19936 TaxID=1385520 RepID=A0A0A0J254_9MICO|nr:hypothetical protein N802_04615 [Knoellia sinensis KCTC 19936]